jgi:hypothetical protein
MEVTMDVPNVNPLLRFPGHLDPNDPLEKEFVEELARLHREDLERAQRAYDQQCSNSSLPLTDVKPEEKINDIREHFSSVIGSIIVGYETVEFLNDGGRWDTWPDLPIRLQVGPKTCIAIAWSGYDDLWLAMDLSLPFSVEGSTIRWVKNSIEKINSAIGATIHSVTLGRGEMSIEGRDIEIWTRLMVQTDLGWLEIFNALDENGYDFHLKKPVGTFVSCI